MKFGTAYNWSSMKEIDVDVWRCRWQSTQFHGRQQKNALQYIQRPPRRSNRRSEIWDKTLRCMSEQ